jgi:flagellar export protein FliJ
MKKSQFSLQALQTLRERQEQQAMQEYSNALTAWEEARDKVNALQKELEAAWAQMQRSALDNCAAGVLDHNQAYCQSVERRKRAAEHAAKTARNQASQVFTKLLAARQARAVVEKFFDNQKSDHERERRRHEQHSQDEMFNHQSALTALLAMKRENLWN